MFFKGGIEMKTVKQLTYLVVMVGTIGFLAGCGTETTDKKATPRVEGPSMPSSVTNQALNNIFDTVGIQHELLRNVENGVFVGVGYEYIDRGMTTFNAPPQFPTAIKWYTRIEFIKEDGQSKVDPESFGRPYGERRWVKFILENDSQPGLQYVAIGHLSFTWETGSIRGGQILTGYGSQDKIAQFEVLFQNSRGEPVPLGLRDNGLIRIGQLIVKDRSGNQHVIQY